MEINTVHHYTDINTLALILKHQTIRLNRLDGVDDISESEAYKKVDLAKYLFVSCWTYVDEESIPQWYMYTDNMAGVRITFPRKFFKYRPIDFPSGVEKFVEGEKIAPVPYERIFADHYIILPIFLSPEQIERKVEYVESVEEQYENLIRVKRNPNGIDGYKFKEIHKLAKFKNKAWSFQKEYRYVMFILPSVPPNPETGPFGKEFGSRLAPHLDHHLSNGLGPGLDYFDLDIELNVLNNIKVTLGPLCSEGDKLIVKSLIDNYTDNGEVEESKLAGTIRNPKS